MTSSALYAVWLPRAANLYSNFQKFCTQNEAGVEDDPFPKTVVANLTLMVVPVKADLKQKDYGGKHYTDGCFC